MKNKILKNHIGLIGSFVILAGCGLADDSQKRAQIDCLNHLKQLGLTVVVDAKDHEDTIPRDFLFLTNHSISPAVLLCPMDLARKGSAVSATEQQLPPAQLSATNISYQLVTPGAKLTASNSQALVRCPFHRQLSYVEGAQIKAKSEQSPPPVADVLVHARAQFALGMDYYEGKLVKMDFVEAHKWFSLAKRSGYPEAKPLLREIELFMTPTQIIQSQMQVEEWKVKASPQPQPRPAQPS